MSKLELQQELEQLTPIPDDELERAANLIENFEEQWKKREGDRKAQQELMQMIVARVWVRGDDVAMISLRPNFHITVGLKSEKSTELQVDITENVTILNRERRASNPAVYKTDLAVPPLKSKWRTVSSLFV